MSEEFFGLVIIALAVGLWIDGARARERAIQHCRRACREQGVQFLDETVVFSRLGVGWTRQGVRLRRTYRFDFSVQGVERYNGEIRMLGSALERFSLGVFVADTEVLAADPPKGPTLH